MDCYSRIPLLFTELPPGDRPSVSLASNGGLSLILGEFDYTNKDVGGDRSVKVVSICNRKLVSVCFEIIIDIFKSIKINANIRFSNEVSSSPDRVIWSKEKGMYFPIMFSIDLR